LRPVTRRISRRKFLQVSAAAAAAGAAYAADRKMPGLLAGSSPPARKVLTRDLRFSPSELNNGTLSGLSGEADGLRLRRDQAAGHYLSPALESELPFHFAGIYWSGSWRDGAEPSFWLRTSADGVHWDDWHPAQVELPPGPRAEYQRYGSLIGADGHRYVQFMSELSGGADSVLERIGLTLLNPYDGPDLQPSPPPAGRAAADAAGEPGPAYAVLPKPLTFSREAWDATRVCASPVDKKYGHATTCPRRRSWCTIQ
jgi:hypothetical protein